MLKEKCFESDENEHKTTEKACEFWIGTVKETADKKADKRENKSYQADNRNGLEYGQNGNGIDDSRQSNADSESVNACSSGKDKEIFNIDGRGIILCFCVKEHFHSEKKEYGK